MSSRRTTSLLHPASNSWPHCNVDNLLKHQMLIRHGIIKSPICQAISGSKFPVVLRVFVNASGEMGPLRFNVLALRTPTWHTAIQSWGSLLELWVKPHSPWFLLKIRQGRTTSPRVYGRSWHIVASGTNVSGPFNCDSPRAMAIIVDPTILSVASADIRGF